LVNSDFEYIMSGDGDDILESCLTIGFKGYRAMTDEELIMELEQRDISSNFGNDD